MTGRIKNLSTGSASGFIRAENGLNVHFEPSAVLAYDAACLAVGQMVTFDLESRDCTEAVNVHVQKARPAVPALKGQENIPLRYVGFEQNQSLRAYRFDRRSPGEETVTFVVTADLTLFAKHRIAIQEGPSLCLRLLMTGLDSPDAPGTLPLRCALSEQDLLMHIARRPVPPPRRRPVARKPGAAPNAFGQKTW